jgi:hypothetical protein
LTGPEAASTFAAGAKGRGHAARNAMAGQHMMHTVRRVRGGHGVRRFLATFMLASVVACGAEGPTVVEPDPTIAPFVGTWDAQVFDVTSDADTTRVADLTVNGVFNINVQPSGTYTATLTFGGIPIVEIGIMSVAGGFITLRPNGGDPATSAFTLTRPDYLVLDGPTEFDFNQDLVLDPAQAHIELQRR